MTTRDEMETRLLQAVAIEPSEAGLRWLDQRVANVAERPVALPRRGLFARRLILRPVLLLAAFLLLAGAVAAGLGLLDRIVESSGQPGWHTAWDRAERLDLTATDAGVTIKVERAYADLNQVLVGFTVAGLEVPTTAVEEPPRFSGSSRSAIRAAGGPRSGPKVAAGWGWKRRDCRQSSRPGREP